ncbi:MAG: glutamate 5-kinase [Planctomycetota bacterium]
MRDKIKTLKTIVIKIGSNLLTRDDGELNGERIDALALEVGALLKAGRRVVIISSGAVAAGRGMIGITGRPTTLPEFQAAAAAGQIALMQRYFIAFGRGGVNVAQLLLTRDDFGERTRYLNIRNCLAHLLDHGVVPIINENDPVAVDELKFGDNDILAGYVTTGLMADLLVILTSVEGLLGPDRKVIPEVAAVDESIDKLVFAGTTSMGMGGMASKISTARVVTASGEAVVIADGRRPGVLADIFAGREVGTLFLPAPRKLTGRQRWMAFSARETGSVTVDAGAVRAICGKGTSLLPAGITAVTGDFASGALVAIRDEAGAVIAKGLTNYSAEEIGRIKGMQTKQIAKVLGYAPYHEVIHRDNLVLAGK